VRRLAGLGLLSLALYLAGNLWQPPLPRTYQPLFLAWLSALFLPYLAAVAMVRRGMAARHARSLPVILTLALLFRGSLLWTTPGFLSDDIYRYSWDGLVQQAGVNPYLYPPASPALAFLRDGVIFPMLNRPWAPTIYPPGAQACFAAMAELSPRDVTALKAVMVLADLAAVGLLLRLLGALDRDPALALLYAWNPLVVVEVAISGHLDALMLPFILLAFLSAFRQRPWLAGLALCRRRPWPALLAFAASVGMGNLLYADAGPRLIGYLPGYLSSYEAHNLSLRAILTWLLRPVTDDAFGYSQWLGAAVLLPAMGWCVWRRPTVPQDLVRWGTRFIALYLLLVSPSVFPWYLLWLLALATLQPGWTLPAWLYWSWSINLDDLEPLFGSDALTWLHAVEYGPVFLWLGGYGLWRRGGQTPATAAADAPLACRPVHTPGLASRP
jgi:alpha-1,6-mannosyltransferase